MKIINAIINGKTTKLAKVNEDIVSVKEGMFKVEVTEVYI